MIYFHDRLGNVEELDALPGERLADLLLRHRIPPSSTIALAGETVRPDSHPIVDGTRYDVSLIEGYDVNRIRSLCDTSDDQAPNNDIVYEKRRLILDEGGNFEVLRQRLDLDSIVGFVEGLVRDTFDAFKIDLRTGLVLGLSGGVDSSSLLLALHAILRARGGGNLIAVTFEDYDSDRSPTFERSTKLCADLGIRHEIAPADLARQIFHLRKPLKSVLTELMGTEDRRFVMYIDHHTTRRTLEVFAKSIGVNRLALGLHTTDLVAGLLNGWMTGFDVAGIPARTVGEFEYIYPLAFVNKKELHLYHYARTGTLATHTLPNDWERDPLDRNFYYYLADLLQSTWPGLEILLFSGQNRRQRGRMPLVYRTCNNCGAAILDQTLTVAAGSRCDACSAFDRAGFLE